MNTSLKPKLNCSMVAGIAIEDQTSTAHVSIFVNPSSGRLDVSTLLLALLLIEIVLLVMQKRVVHL